MKKLLLLILLLISCSVFSQKYLISDSKQYISGVLSRINQSCISDNIWRDGITNSYANIEISGTNKKFALLYYDSIKYHRYWLESELLNLKILPKNWSIDAIDTISSLQYNVGSDLITVRYKLNDTSDVLTTVISTNQLNPEWNNVREGFNDLFNQETLMSIAYQNKSQNNIGVERFNIITINANIYDCRTRESQGVVLIPMDLQYKIYYLSEKIKSILKQ